MLSNNVAGVVAVVEKLVRWVNVTENKNLRQSKHRVDVNWVWMGQVRLGWVRQGSVGLGYVTLG